MAFGLFPLVRGHDGRGEGGLLAFVVALVGSAAAVGGAFAFLGGELLTASSFRPGVILAAGIALLVELELLPFNLPSRDWQVPRDWPDRYGVVPGFAFWGGVLGVGVASYVPYASFHVLVAWSFFSGSATTGLALGCSYGVGRALASVIPALLAARNPHAIASLAEGMISRESWMKGVQISALLCVLGVQIAGVGVV